MKLAVKIDVDTYRGTRDGVLPLCKVLKKHGVPATFLFSFGPDNTGKALRRIFRKGFLKKCLRSNVAGNYGLKTLMYGTLLKAPRIAKLCAAQMRKKTRKKTTFFLPLLFGGAATAFSLFCGEDDPPHSPVSAARRSSCKSFARFLLILCLPL